MRLVPNIANPEETFFHYGIHAFTSLSTNSFIDATCPRASGERCPICEHRMRIYKSKSEEDRNFAYSIRTQGKAYGERLCDFLTPQIRKMKGRSRSSVSASRFTRRSKRRSLETMQMNSVLYFRPTEEGCSFKIKVESTSEGKRSFTNIHKLEIHFQGSYPWYDSRKDRRDTEGHL